MEKRKPDFKRGDWVSVLISPGKEASVPQKIFMIDIDNVN
jgi:hypothetical protein